MAHSRKQVHRKSLRQSLKTLLQLGRRRSVVNQPKTVGSGILRKADPLTVSLPMISTISLFPNFDSTQFDLDKYSIRSPTDLFHNERSRYLSKASLLPSTRLSEVNLHEVYLQQIPKVQHVRYEIIPERLARCSSRKGSLVSNQSGHLHPSPSLRIQRSSRSLSRNDGNEQINLPRPVLRQVPSLRRRSRSSLIEKPAFNPPPTDLPTQNSSNQLIKHFRTFCVLDSSTPGCPVTATSEDLRYIFDVGEQFFLHNQECTGTSLDIVTGCDASGNDVTHLVLFCPLISPSSGRSRFMLAALIDITDFIQDAVSMPELETISEESMEEEEQPLTPEKINRRSVWKMPSYELSAEQLLGGCFLDDEMGDTKIESNFLTPARARTLDDVWLNLTSEENNTDNARKRRSLSGSPASYRSSIGTSTEISVVGSVLDEFVSALQQLYSNFFLLAKSPLDENYYEICNVSPSAYESKDFVQGHLSRTSASDLQRLSAQLGEDSSFSMAVRWGSKGRSKQLYCIPLFGQRSVTWICMLVDIGEPNLW